MSILKNGLKKVLWSALVLTCIAEAKTATMTWDLLPNAPIQKSTQAVTRFLSAKCVTDIKSGQLTLQINGLTHTLTPENNSATFPRINGRTSSVAGKVDYNYSILWKDSMPSSRAKLICVGNSDVT